MRSYSIFTRRPVVCSILHPRRFLALYFRRKMADSGNFDEEQAAEMLTIQPYHFERRVSADAEHILGNECMTRDEKANPRLPKFRLVCCRSYPFIVIL